MEAGRPIYMLFDANGTNLSSSSTILLDPALHQPHCKELSFFGPVNGLYCVYNGIHNFVIWNPATEEVGFLPSAAELLPTTDSTLDSLADPLTIYHAYVGFGVDPINERDYKLVIICKYNRLTSRDDKGFSRMLYTTRTNRWRLVDDNGLMDDVDTFPYDSKNMYLKGFYYWGVRREGGLLVFDMGQKENFHTVCGPDNISYQDRNEVVLHKNHISVIIVHDTPCEIDIWVLHEEVSKWTKTTSLIGVPRILTSRGFLGNNDDELLLLIDDALQIYARQIVLYNTSTQKVEKNIGPPGNVMSKITIGYESVISLNGMDMTTYRGNYGSSANVISRFLFQSSSTE